MRIIHSLFYVLSDEDRKWERSIAITFIDNEENHDYENILKGKINIGMNIKLIITVN